MTRDQAIKILSRIWGGEPQHGLAKSYADAFEALGIIKFDDRKETLWQILRRHQIPLDVAQWICNDAHNAGITRFPQDNEQ